MRATLPAPLEATPHSGCRQHVLLLYCSVRLLLHSQNFIARDAHVVGAEFIRVDFAEVPNRCEVVDDAVCRVGDACQSLVLNASATLAT